MTTPPRSLWLVALVLGVAVLAANVRVVLGGMTWSDVRYHAEIAPPRLAAAAAVHDGKLPAWWDGSGLGVPLAAEPTHGALNPSTWPASSARGLDLILIAHLAWLALGVAVWARRKGRTWTRVAASEEAALVAGVLAATTGLAASTLLRGTLPALSDLPWVGAMAAWLADPGEDAAPRARATATLALAALIGFIGLSGSGAGLIDAVIVAVAIGWRRGARAPLAAGIAAGLGIAAIQWLPAALHILDGETAGAASSPLPFARLVELVVPGSFGSADPARGLVALASEHAWAPSLFAGVALLSLASVRTPSRRALAVLGLLGGLAVVTGRGTAWPAWLGAPEHHLAALVIVLAANAGAGIDALLAAERRAVRALAVGIACGAIALAALAMLRVRGTADHGPIVRALVEGGLGLVCCGAALVIAAKQLVPKHATPIVLALLVLPSVGGLGSTAPLTSREAIDDAPVWAGVLEDRIHPGDPPVRVFRPAFMTRESYVGLAETVDTLGGGIAWQWGVALARSEDPARPRVHDDTWIAASREGGVLLDRLGIEHAILPASLVREAKAMTALDRRGDWTLSRLPVAPVAAVMRGSLWAVDPADALELLYPLAGHTNVLRGTVVLRGAGRADLDAGDPLACGVSDWRAGDIELVCASPSPGYAVVTSTAAAGWSVTVDGYQTSWLHADLLRRAVPVSAGLHTVQWTYSTPGQRAGLVAALAGLALLAGAFAGSRKRSASRP